MSENGGSALSDYQAMNRTAFIIGYTGETGKELVKALNKSKPFSKVFLIGRRQIDLDPSLGPEFEQKIVDFDRLDEHTDAFKDTHVGYCCLGTTRRKSGREGFIKVDKEYVLKSAEIAKEQGCKHFSVVSSVGSNKNSWFLYTRIKGEVEEALSNMKFERLSIFRPALLVCDREDSRCFEAMLTVMIIPFAKLFPTTGQVKTSIFGEAIVADTIIKNDEVVTVYDNSAIHKLAKQGS